MARRLALITGASAGIGAEFARQYAARGWDVALTARRADRLEHLALELEGRYGCATFSISQDLAVEKSVDTLLAELRETGRHVDALINNAGYGLPGTFLNTRWEDQAAFIRVLFTVPCELVHKLLPGMAERNFGRIINVASLVGHLPGSAGHTLYAPVKAAMIKFSEAVHAEAKTAGVNIHATALCPGLTWTEFHDVNGTRSRTNQTPDWMWMQAGPVVEAGIDAVDRGMPVVVPGAQNKGFATLAKLLPDPIARAVMREQSRRYRDLKD